MDKLEEFSLNGPKNTDGLTLLSGFPSNQKPARQWFNWLFNSITKKINEIIDGKLDASANAVSAAKLETGRKINFTGVIQGSGTFDGSTDITIDTIGGGTLGEKAIAIIRLNGSTFDLVKSRGFASVANMGGGQIEFTLSEDAPDTDYGVVCTGTANDTAAVSFQEREDFARTKSKFRLMGAYGGDNTQGPYTPKICTVVVYY
ncbi:autotransporter outer membrane beta-barrel domain-containing protein [Acinetobacter baumannii]|uniref:autotransporter outer membrane beta-barrel domain-containing protein n=1 Tax=Acinetobacter baumannii TaxID=470 RepID=UPI00244A4060|nr:autotransporter outer membrane beta-barrel domain-containing protein [Acinetobacter baumannii]MDH2580997.1 autotransporter outer membrane beta-barrel domain-containing protein [Acinetobacter baumannii]